MTFSTAKRDEIARLLNILELDFEQKNFLPPREMFLLYARDIRHVLV